METFDSLLELRNNEIHGQLKLRLEKEYRYIYKYQILLTVRTSGSFSLVAFHAGFKAPTRDPIVVVTLYLLKNQYLHAVLEVRSYEFALGCHRTDQYHCPLHRSPL